MLKIHFQKYVNAVLFCLTIMTYCLFVWPMADRVIIPEIAFIDINYKPNFVWLQHK